MTDGINADDDLDNASSDGAYDALAAAEDDEDQAFHDAVRERRREGGRES